MGHQGHLWKAALAEAKLSVEEEDLLARLRDETAGFGDELTVLVSHLRANLGAEFLRALVDNLSTGLEPELCVVRSLRQTIATSALHIGLRSAGDRNGCP